jgi:hypothetical protein
MYSFGVFDIMEAKEAIMRDREAQETIQKKKLEENYHLTRTIGISISRE